MKLHLLESNSILGCISECSLNNLLGAPNIKFAYRVSFVTCNNCKRTKRYKRWLKRYKK